MVCSSRAGSVALVCIVLLLGLTGCNRPSTDVSFVDGDARAFTVDERTLLEAVVRASVDDARKLLPRLPARLRVELRSGSQVIPETGEGGETRQPEKVLITVDPQHDGGVRSVAQKWLRACVLHELHHLVRDAVIRRSSLLEVAVTEGMATAFERDFASVSPPWGQYGPEAADWIAELRDLPPDTPRADWIRRHPDGRRWIALRAGTYVVDRAMRATHRTAAELVTAPTAELLRLAQHVDAGP